MSEELVFLAGRFEPHCNSRVDKYYEGYSVLQFMESGALELAYDAKEYALEGSWFWTCEPGPHVRFNVARQARSWPHRYVSLNGPLLNRWKLAGLWFSEPQQVENGAAFAARFDELLAFTERGDAWGSRLAANALERILLELAEKRARGAVSTLVNESWLETVQTRLADVYTDADYNELAAACGMSLSHLRLQFRQAAGVPLHTYVMQRRIAAARSMLIETDLPLKAIADRLGYSDVHFFSRQFRRFAGTTPGAYRKSRQG